MTQFLRILGTANTWIARVCLWGSAMGLAVMTLIIGWQVFARYVLNDTPNWSEQFCLLLMIYYILFAAAVGVRDKTHIGLTFVRDAMPPLMKRFFFLFINIMLAAFGVTMIVYGLQMAQTTWTHVIPTLGLSVGLSYLPFPLAGVLFTLFALEHLLGILFGVEVKPSWN